MENDKKPHRRGERVLQSFARGFSLFNRLPGACAPGYYSAAPSGLFQPLVYIHTLTTSMKEETEKTAFPMPG